MINIIALLILAVIIGASGWQGMEDYGKSFSGVVRAISELPKGIPSAVARGKFVKNAGIISRKVGSVEELSALS